MIYKYYRYKADSIEEATDKIKEFHKIIHKFTKNNPSIDIQITLSAITQIPLYIEIETWQKGNHLKQLPEDPLTGNLPDSLSNPLLI